MKSGENSLAEMNSIDKMRAVAVLEALRFVYLTALIRYLKLHV
jgi:hypothetical protein